MAPLFERLKNEDFEQVVYCQDRSTGLKAIIAVHSTALGAATGGCRMYDYASEGDALTDVLRLSKGMTYKAALAGLNWGGGKSVLIGDPKTKKNPAMLQRFGRFVETLGGTYITAKDVGIGSEDLKEVKKATTHVLGIEGLSESSGDPSPATAYGVYHGLLACAQKVNGKRTLSGVRVAVQGLGSVAYYLLEHLAREGAVITACDIDAEMVKRAKEKYPSIEVVKPEAIYDVSCDVFSPCALGASINSKTLPRIRAKVIAGGANNQLATPEDGYELLKRGICYAPDYVLNAGGLINIYYEHPASGAKSYQKTQAYEHVSKIEKTITEILERSERAQKPSSEVADHMAEERVEKARKKRNG